MKERDYVRLPAVAGLFYPAKKDELERTVGELLERASQDINVRVPGKMFGIISPHAGYPYSGYTAAHGYSLLSRESFKTVVIISPSHREYFDGVSVFPGRAYSTPLGNVEIDGELRNAFMEKAGDMVIDSSAGHRGEHAIEVQLPFLQMTIRNFRLLPIVMGDQKADYCGRLGNVIADIAGDGEVLVIASSDLSHYYDYETANDIDRICIDDVTSGNADRLLSDLENRRCEACGGGPIASSLYAGAKAGFMQIAVLHHCNSGDSSGDKSAVVGYLSAVIS